MASSILSLDVTGLNMRCSGQLYRLTSFSSTSISAALVTIGPRTAYSMARTFGLSVSIVSTRPPTIDEDLVDVTWAAGTVDITVRAGAAPFTMSTVTDITREKTVDNERR